MGLDGGMAEYKLIPGARFLIPLLDGLDPVHAAPLTDAGLTPHHAIRRALPKLVPGSTAVVTESGGLGHMGLPILKATTATTIIAVDQREPALKLALNNGADMTLKSGEDTVAEIREATGGRGADVVLDFVGADATLAMGTASTRSLGDLES